MYYMSNTVAKQYAGTHDLYRIWNLLASLENIRYQGV
jgi:hypothetical protein